MPIRTLTLVLTSDCNLRCEYCYLQRNRTAKTRWPILSEALDVLLPGRADELEVVFTGGEPLLEFPTLKRVVEHVDRLRGNGRSIRWRLLTNGLLLTDEHLAFFDGHQFQISLSFDGAPPAQAARGAGTFERLDALFSRISDRHQQLWHLRLKTALTLSPHNVPFFAESIAYLARKGVRTVSVAPAMGQGGWHPDRRAELDTQFQRVSELLARHYARTGLVPLTMFRKTRQAGPEAPPEWLCLAHRGENLTIDVDGQAYGCVLATASYQQGTAPAMRPVVASLWAGRPGASGFDERPAGMTRAAQACGSFQFSSRRYSSYGRCAECRWAGQCQVCPLAAAIDPEWVDPHRVPDFLCAFNQVRLAHIDRFPCQYDPLTCLAGETSPAS